MSKFLRGWVPLVVLAGCGALIPADVDDQPLSFPDREFRLDADELGLTDNAAVMPTIACGQCTQEIDSFCSASSCRATCDASSATCKAEVDLLLSETYDLRDDGQGFAALDGIGAEITIDEVSFEIVTNTLNVATPELSIYLAPVTVADISDGRARWIGSVSPIPPGARGTRTVTFTPEGRAHLQSFVDAYLTPFNLLVVTRVSVRAGELVPAGMVVGKVRVRAHADLGG
jgi:hypothetical protein